jgi:hypothetical protein
VKGAAKNCEKKRKRGHLMRPLLADHDGKELEGFANDIKEALQVFKVSEFSYYEHTPLINSDNETFFNRHPQTSTK